MISVVTPVYNGETYIEACLKSVIDQGCTQVEHLIMDGGSGDRTVEILKAYSQNYAHIRWVSEKDRGQSDAMNKGVRMAKSDIIAVLNVDDYYEKNTLNRVLAHFTDLPEPSLLVGNCNIWNEQGRLRKVNKPSKLKLSDLLLGYQVNPHPVNPSAYFYHKSLHEQIGPYLVDEHYIMDLHFIFRAVQVAHVKYVDELWGNYRDLAGTKTYCDRASGAGAIRQEQFYQSYLDKLPPYERSLVKLKRAYYSSRAYEKLQRVGPKFERAQYKLGHLRDELLNRPQAMRLNKVKLYDARIQAEARTISHHALETAQQIRSPERGAAIFIHGIMPRSGTVYTGEILRLHPDLYAYPNEIWEVPFLKYSDKLYDFGEGFLSTYPQNQGKMGKHDFLPLFGAAFLRYLHGYVPDHKRMLLKVPNVYHLSYFFSMFPHENLLLLLRDGRDVVSSTLKTWPDSDFEEICRRWQYGAQTILGFVDDQRDRTAQIFLARYEQIVQDPADFARTACDHFRLAPQTFPWGEIDTLPVRGSSSFKAGDAVSWEPIPKGVAFKTAGKWHDWPEQMKDTFKEIAGQTLIKAGYASDFHW